MKTKLAPQIAACTLALRVAAEGGLTRLIPAGRFDAPRGSMTGSGPWLLDQSHAQSIIQRAAARSTDLVVDYEHQTLEAPRNGKPAPASGWIDRASLQWRDDGLYGRITWTAAAKAAIDADEYRYLSPVFPYDTQTGHVLDLLHVGLTNNPAIDTAIPALAAARMGGGAYDPTPEDTTVDRETLLKLLGLPSDATDEQITQAINQLKQQAANAEQAVAAARAAAAPDMSQFVPRAVLDEAQQQLAALRAQGEVNQLDSLIEQGLKDGRIAGKATADWLKGQGLAACRSYLKDAPPLAALNATQTEGKKPEGGPKGAKTSELSAAEVAVCRSMGLSAEEFRKYNPVEE